MDQRYVFLFTIKGQIEFDVTGLPHNDAYEMAQDTLSNFNGWRALVEYFNIYSVNIEEECRKECEVREKVS